MGILTVGVVTKPFAFEGKRRANSAEAGIEELQKYVDTLIVIPNQNLFLIANANTTFKEAFEMADEVLQQGVRGITDLMVMPGLINLDFADVRSVMQEMGKAMMGTGEADRRRSRARSRRRRRSPTRCSTACAMNGAKGVIVSITGGDDMRLLEVDEAANHIRELVDRRREHHLGFGIQPRARRQDPRLGRRGPVSRLRHGRSPRAAPASRAFSFSAHEKGRGSACSLVLEARPAAGPVAFETAEPAAEIKLGAAERRRRQRRSWCWAAGAPGFQHPGVR